MVYTPGNDTNTNPYGAVALFDNESPCTFSALAVATVSGGQFVYVSGTNGAVLGSAAAQYVTSDLLVAPATIGEFVNGIALYNMASGTNNYVAIARKGSFLVQATDVVSGGATVVFSSGGVANLFSASAGSGTAPGASQFGAVGKAQCAADSGGYTLLALNL